MACPRLCNSFYSLRDKICREDVLLEAYCRCRANVGAAGVDGETFERIETRDQNHWLETLREELVSGEYAPKPLLRMWIPKSNRGQRPLGIPTIRDRVVHMAVVLILSPIFEADLVLLCHKRREQQNGQQASCLSRNLASGIRSVAMECGLCRSARTRCAAWPEFGRNFRGA